MQWVLGGRMKKSTGKYSLLCSSALALLVPSLVHAQASPPTENPAATEEPADNTIVVTGTQIRGIKPVGSAVVTQSREDIDSSGKNDLNQILAELPQSQQFNGIAQPGGEARGGSPAVGTFSAAIANVPVNRPNLRNIPGVSLGTGAVTLVMIDGHRLVPVGTNQAVVDLGLIPTNIIERNEIMLDGASAIYGSDAVGGTLNIITRKRYDGVRVGGHYGFADDYWQRDFNVVAGKNWGTGGFVFSYEYAANSGLLNRDRPYLLSRNFFSLAGDFTGTGAVCATPTVTVSGGGGSARIEGAGIVAGAPARCPSNEWNSFVAPQKRHSVFIAGEQQLSDTVKLDVTGLYSIRTNKSWETPAAATGIAQTSASPFYRQLPGGTPGASQTLAFNLGPALGFDSQQTDLRVEFFNVTPQLTVDVGSWQVRALVDYGQSWSKATSQRPDLTALPANAWTTVLNPYDVGSSSPAGLALLRGTLRQTTTSNKQQFLQTRLVADGPLFTLPGGEVRAAVGAEWIRHRAEYQLTNAAFVLQPPSVSTTNAKGVFGEIVVPLVSSQNAMPFIAGLTLSASGRWDDYGQYGSTFNPRLAATFNPVDWITVRGSWAKTFRAPNAIDNLPPTVTCANSLGNFGCNPGFGTNPAAPGTGAPSGYNFSDPAQPITAIFLGGGVGTAPSARPESATNWSVGIDLDPPFVPGLHLSATYWEIDFRNQISRLGASVGGVADTALTIPGNTTRICVPANLGGTTPPRPATPADATCTAADAAAFLGNATGASALLASIAASGQTIVAFIDQRQNNLGFAKLAGIDASMNYRTETRFGSIDARAAVSIPTRNQTQASPVALIRDSLATGTPDYRITAALGANIDRFRAQVSWQFSSAYVAATYQCRLDPAGCTPAQAAAAITRDLNQYEVGQFDTIDLFFRYVFENHRWLKDLELTLNINNVFDSRPPTELTTTGGVAGGQTVGRLVQFGIAKRF